MVSGDEHDSSTLNKLLDFIERARLHIAVTRLKALNSRGRNTRHFRELPHTQAKGSSTKLDL